MANQAKPKVKMGRITNTALKNYVDAKKNPTILTGEVDRYLQSRVSDRDSTVIHPSEMASPDWCHRATWHRLSGRHAAATTVPLRSNKIFGKGDDVHAKWQRWLKDMGILWGMWLCQACGNRVMEWSQSLEYKCDVAPHGHLWVYKEVPLISDPLLNIAGRADGIVNPSKDEPILLEIKSIGPGTLRMLGIMATDDDDEETSTRFSRIAHPLPSHFTQVQIYLRLARMYESAIGQIPRGLLLYENKADQQTKEFVIDYGERWTNKLFDWAELIMWAVKNDHEVECPKKGCPQCQAYEGASS